MPGSDREVFVYLTCDENTRFELDLLTYAMFANEKDEWIRHFFDQQGREPEQPEIDDWIANITEYRFAQMRNEATSFFDVAARNYLKDEIEAEKQSVLESEIVAHVKAAGSFWKQLSIALITAILAPIIIGGIILAALAYNQVLPTLIQMPAVIQAPGDVRPQ